MAKLTKQEAYALLMGDAAEQALLRILHRSPRAPWDTIPDKLLPDETKRRLGGDLAGKLEELP